ncbi:hypothetical protein D4R87_01175 [bacterium]|nr:MAG: hypothetical protein D4R87_01175 [bacterium]
MQIKLSDNLQFDESAQIDGYNYENFDSYQGTVKVWLKPFWDGTDTNTHEILTNDNTNYTKIYYSAGNLYLDSYDGTTTHRVYQDVSDWTAGTWYHVVGAWSNENAVNIDSTGYLVNIYVNGSDSGNTYSSATYGTNFWTAFTPGTIYVGENSSAANQFDGLLSGLIIENYPWSEDDASTDYNSGTGTAVSISQNALFYLPANSADADGIVRYHLKNYREVTAGEYGLVGGWNFEEATGSDVADVTGDYDGTLNQTDHWSTTGKYGGTYDFDGTDDYVDLGDVEF